MMGSTAAKQVLDRIASGEASGYDVLYGGHKFTDFSVHPNIKFPIGNGLYTTAAGRYQLLAPTWAAEQKRLNLPDFKPASQDAAAWDLAQRTYTQKTGRSLETDAGKGQVDWQQLVSQWPSLNKTTTALTIKPTSTTGKYPLLTNPPELEAALHPDGAGSGNALEPTAPSSTPASPSGLSLATVQSLFPKIQLSPVDYNPFAVAPRLQPVDHDPFAKPEGTSPT